MIRSIKIEHVVVTLITALMVVGGSCKKANAFPVSLWAIAAPSDSTKLQFPIEERQGDHVTGEHKNSFDLEDPPSITKTVEYDPATDSYIITEKVGDVNIKLT